MNVFPSPSVAASPFGTCGRSLDIRANFNEIVHDFKMNDSIRKTRVIESKAKINVLRTSVHD